MFWWDVLGDLASWRLQAIRRPPDTRPNRMARDANPWWIPLFLSEGPQRCAEPQPNPPAKDRLAIAFHNLCDNSLGDLTHTLNAIKGKGSHPSSVVQPPHQASHAEPKPNLEYCPSKAPKSPRVASWGKSRSLSHKICLNHLNHLNPLKISSKPLTDGVVTLCPVWRTS